MGLSYNIRSYFVPFSSSHNNHNKNFNFHKLLDTDTDDQSGILNISSRPKGNDIKSSTDITHDNNETDKNDASKVVLYQLTIQTTETIHVFNMN
jgi:hypothetical protein